MDLVVTTWVHHEAIIGVNVSSLVHSVIARSQSPGGIPFSTTVAVIIPMLILILRTRGEREVHEMRDGRLSLAAACGLHGGGFSNSILIREPEALRLFVLALRSLVVPCAD